MGRCKYSLYRNKSDWVGIRAGEGDVRKKFENLISIFDTQEHMLHTM